MPAQGYSQHSRQSKGRCHTLTKPPLGLANVRRNYTPLLRRKLFIIATLPFLARWRENKKVGFDLWRKSRV